MGTLGAGSPSKRIPSHSSVGTAEQHDNVIVGHYEREFHAILKPALDRNESEEIAYYGSIAEKLSRTLRRLLILEPNQMRRVNKLELLLSFGDKLCLVREFRAASLFFYKPALQLIDPKASTSNCPGEHSLPQNKQGQMYIRSMFGVASCCIQREQLLDPYIRQPGTLERLDEALKMIQDGMRLAVDLEMNYTGQFAWLLLNGSIAIFSTTTPLIRLGFSQEAVSYLKWCLLALNSSVMLSTTQFILWKLQLTASICACYDTLAVTDTHHRDNYRRASQACAEFALGLVQRLHKEEELDMPLPESTKQTLDRAQSIVTILITWSKAADLNQLSKAIESAFTEPIDRIRAAVEYMERITKQTHDDSHGRSFLASYSPEDAGVMKSLCSFVMDIIHPLSEQLNADEESKTAEARKNLDMIFPMSLHLAMLRYNYCLGPSGSSNLTIMITSIRNRMSEPSKGVLEQEMTAIWHFIAIFEGLNAIRNNKLSSDNEHETLPTTLAADEKSLRKLACSLRQCILEDCGGFCVNNRDLLIAATLIIWEESKVLLKATESIDASKLPPREIQLLMRLLESIHLVLDAVAFEDTLLHSHIVLQLGSLLLTTGQPRVAYQVAYQMIQRIDEHRDRIAHIDSFRKATITQQLCTNSTFAPGLSDATFSCCFSLGDLMTKIDSNLKERDDVGVNGTGSQFGRLHQDLGCTQTDLLLLLYRAELQAASITNTQPPLPLGDKCGKFDATSSQFLSDVESRMVSLCLHNGYRKALFFIQQLMHPSQTTENHVQIAEECFKALRRMEKHERNAHLRASNAVNSNPNSSSTSVKINTVPVAPVVITRASSLMVVKIVEIDASRHVVHNRPVCFYMIYGKPVGAGTAVSLNNNQLPGTASPVFPSEHMLVTISGLIPNESYVFAVAAYDERGELINGIGATSEPVIALNPLPLPLCYGYFAQTCQTIMLTSHAKRAAKHLYSLVVSSKCAQRYLWQANPYYRQALRREIIAKLPVPILDQCARALYILNHDEIGDPELDGMLISNEPGGRSLLSSQVAVLESVRQIVIGVEIAAAAGNQSVTLQLCFKGYQILLPLLHLTSGCGGVVYPSLVTLIQALQAVEHDVWGVEARKLFARFQFELFRILTIQDDLEVSESTNPLLLPLKSVVHSSTDTAELLESRCLDEALTLRQFCSTPASIQGSPSSQSSSTPPAKNTSSAQKSTGTPQQTPRSAEDSGVHEDTKMPSIRDILVGASCDAEKALKQLETRLYSDKRHIEVSCKVASAALPHRNLDEVEAFLVTLKATGDVSEKFRSVLKTAGAESLLPTNPRGESTPPDSALSPRSPITPSISKDNVDRICTSEFDSEYQTEGPDDMYLYQWCGEAMFLQAIVTYRRIIALGKTSTGICVTRGPFTEDCIHRIMQNEEVDLPPSASDCSATFRHDVDTTDEVHASNPPDPSDHERFNNLTCQYIAKIAAGCQLFYRARCWQSLQVAVQHLWNTIMHIWISPSKLARSEALVSQLAVCTDTILDVIEQYIASGPTFESMFSNRDQQAEHEHAPASTLIAASTISKLRVNGAWLSNLVTYSIRVFACAKSWERIVRMGERYYACCGSTHEGSRFAELNFPILVHAQNQILRQHNKALVSAQAEHQAFVSAFQEQSAKRKKKKSRLVVEEVVTPEELAFRAREAEMQISIQALTSTRDREDTELQHLQQLHEEIERARNKGQLALDTARELVINYQRRLSIFAAQTISTNDKGDLVILRRQIVSAFTHSIVSCRQKRQRRLVCQAQEELGDFFLSHGDQANAVKSWHECLDNAYSTLRALNTWRTIITADCDDNKAINGDANAAKVEGEELWVALQSFSVLGKLQLHYGTQSSHKALECSLMAATVFTRLYSCSLPHPTKPFMFGSYSLLGSFWPGRDVFLGSESASLFTITLGLINTIESLLQYGVEHAVAVMPVVTGYEYVASYYLNDQRHMTNARRLRMMALICTSRYREAFALLPHILKRGPNPVFSDNEGLQHTSNVAAITWLASIDLSKLAAELKEVHTYPDELVKCILLSVLYLMVKLAISDGHTEIQAKAWRTRAQSMTAEMLDALCVEAKLQITITPDEGNSPSLEKDRQKDPWEIISLYQMRCQVYLLQSSIALSTGQWETAIQLSQLGLSQLSASDALLKEKDKLLLHSLNIDLELKFSPCNQRATLMAKCRLQEVSCHIARGDMHSAIAAADIGIHETQEIEEKLFCSHLQLSRALALAQLGHLNTAISVLEELDHSLVENHCAERSILHVRVLDALSALLRVQATISADTTLLQQICHNLTVAKREVDSFLCSEGWVGIAKPSPIDFAHCSRVLNVHHTSLPLFVIVSLNLAQALTGCPGTVTTAQELVVTRALDLVQSALLVLGEVSFSRQMYVVKAQLLLLGGAILRKKLISTIKEYGWNEATAKMLFNECAFTLKQSIQVSISDGGHDRSLMRKALTELVELFMMGCFPSDKDEHVNAAFHFLSLAGQLYQQESMLFDSVELQLSPEPLNTSSLSADQQLPAHLTEAIIALNESTNESNHDESQKVAPVAPDSSKKASSTIPDRRPQLDAVQVVNYFVRVWRELQTLPAGKEVALDAALRLHYFLVQTHTKYSKMCCLSELSQVPTLAPEIVPGLVCVHWCQDLTPGINIISTTQPDHSNVSLLFTLGTTKIEMSESVISDSAFNRMERFVTMPLLSKRAGLSSAAILEAREELCRLRVDMEDDTSLIIDKASFPVRYRLILRQLQLVFRRANHFETQPVTLNTDVVDLFGNPIPLVCTLDIVKVLEDVFTFTKAVSVADNNLCYFLRDLLD